MIPWYYQVLPEALQLVHPHFSHEGDTGLNIRWDMITESSYMDWIIYDSEFWIWYSGYEDMISDQDILDKMRCDIMGVTQASSQLSPKLSFSTLFRSLPYLAMLLFFFCHWNYNLFYYYCNFYHSVRCAGFYYTWAGWKLQIAFKPRLKWIRICSQSLVWVDQLLSVAVRVRAEGVNHHLMVILKLMIFGRIH